jgi:long-chain acyl-CoA synthetase
VEGGERQAGDGDHGGPSGRPGLRAEIHVAVDEANKMVSHAEAIKKFAILGEDFTEQGGQLTPTLKVRRTIVREQYAAQIAALYGDGAS